MEQGASVRLVKGAYSEDKRIAFQSIEKINSNFSKLMKMLFEYSNTNDNIFAIAPMIPNLLMKQLCCQKNMI